MKRPSFCGACAFETVATATAALGLGVLIGAVAPPCIACGACALALLCSGGAILLLR